MLRLPDWQSRLSAYIDSVSSTPFGYGRLDCGLFAAGAIEAMTGVDVVTDLRGKYRNRREAFVAIKALVGRASMEAASEYLSERYNLPEIPVQDAQRGDPVLCGHGSKSSVGVIAMYGTEILAPAKIGIIRIALTHATRAWHI